MGKLFVISTPIGNLNDITLRAIETLKEVDFIICEDTKTSIKLLNRYEIKKRLESFNSYNRYKKMDLLIQKIKQGTAGLITDSGTPCISDPGSSLVKNAIENGIEVIPIPGVCAFTTLLSVCGLPLKEFIFFGFLSNKKARRKRELSEISKNKKILLFYESPHRIRNFLMDIFEIYDDVKIVIGRELTKKFEEIRRDEIKKIVENIESVKEKGEYTVIIDNRGKK